MRIERAFTRSLAETGIARDAQSATLRVLCERTVKGGYSSMKAEVLRKRGKEFIRRFYRVGTREGEIE